MEKYKYFFLKSPYYIYENSDFSLPSGVALPIKSIDSTNGHIQLDIVGINPISSLEGFVEKTINTTEENIMYKTLFKYYKKLYMIEVERSYNRITNLNKEVESLKQK